VPTRHAVTLPLVEPIVPVLRDRPFEDPAYLFEPKYDGFRGLFYLGSRECHFLSKRGNVLKQFRELCDWVSARAAG
jgi:ATP-dependent DNA ligase